MNTDINKQIEVRTMYMIFRPDGSMMIGSEFFIKSLCLEWMAKSSKYTWKQWYAQGFRCKKVEVTYKEL